MLDAPNMQRSCSEIDLLPPEITDFGCAQPMPERQQHHECVTIALPIGARAIDQLLDLLRCQMLPGA
jgi:hypothetical protein